MDAELAADISRETGQLDEAREEVANATGADERRAAELRQSREETDVAAACARGALSSIDRFFDATDADAGANAAVARLQDLQDECQDAVSES